MTYQNTGYPNQVGGITCSMPVTAPLALDSVLLRAASALDSLDTDFLRLLAFQQRLSGGSPAPEPSNIAKSPGTPTILDRLQRLTERTETIHQRMEAVLAELDGLA